MFSPLSSEVNFTNIFVRLFFLQQDENLYWQMSYVKWFDIDSANFASHIGHVSLVQLETECWWNWMTNFSLNSVRWQLFAWQTKFGEINPRKRIEQHSLSCDRQWDSIFNLFEKNCFQILLLISHFREIFEDATKILSHQLFSLKISI